MTPAGQRADSRAHAARRHKISTVIPCSSLYWKDVTYTVPAQWSELTSRALLSVVLTHAATERGSQWAGPLVLGLGQMVPGALSKVFETYDGSVTHVAGTVYRMRGG